MSTNPMKKVNKRNNRPPPVKVPFGDTSDEVFKKKFKKAVWVTYCNGPGTRHFDEGQWVHYYAYGNDKHEGHGSWWIVRVAGNKDEQDHEDDRHIKNVKVVLTKPTKKI